MKTKFEMFVEDVYYKRKILCRLAIEDEENDLFRVFIYDTKTPPRKIFTRKMAYEFIKQTEYKELRRFSPKNEDFFKYSWFLQGTIFTLNLDPGRLIINLRGSSRNLRYIDKELLNVAKKSGIRILF